MCLKRTCWDVNLFRRSRQTSAQLLLAPCNIFQQKGACWPRCQPHFVREDSVYQRVSRKTNENKRPGGVRRIDPDRLLCYVLRLNGSARIDESRVAWTQHGTNVSSEGAQIPLPISLGAYTHGCCSFCRFRQKPQLLVFRTAHSS